MQMKMGFTLRLGLITNEAISLFENFMILGAISVRNLAPGRFTLARQASR